MEYDLHDAAERGELDKIPREYFTKTNLLEKGKGKSWNVLHYAAKSGCLLQVPKEFLTFENLNKQNKEGFNCFHISAWNGNLTKKKFPENLLTEENLRKPYPSGKEYFMSCFHYAAEKGSLKQLPKEFLTKRNLIDLKSRMGENSLEVAEAYRKLGVFPKKFVTIENLVRNDYSHGLSPLRKILMSDQIDTVFKKLLTPKREDVKFLPELREARVALLMVTDKKTEKQWIKHIISFTQFIEKLECFRRIGEMKSLKL